MNLVKTMLEAAQAEGFKIQVICEGEEDYAGPDAAKALEAVDAVDEAEVSLWRAGDNHRLGWALIVNGLAEDERIADTAYPWMNAWCEANPGG